jgi:hypothetical protein
VEIGNVVERAATALIPLASERRQMVEISVEPGLVHPSADERLLSRVIEALSLELVERGPSATKVALAARRCSGGIEIVLSGAEREDGGEPLEATDEVLPGVLAGLFAERHGGTFRVESGPEPVFRIWLPATAAGAAPVLGDDRMGGGSRTASGDSAASNAPVTSGAPLAGGDPETRTDPESGRAVPGDPAQAA